MVEIFRGKIIDVAKRSRDRRGHGLLGEDRGVRAHGPPVRPDRNGPHGRDRHLARARRDLTQGASDTRSSVSDGPRHKSVRRDGRPTHARGRARGRRARPARGARRAVKRARRTGPPGAARLTTVRVGADVDPSAVVFASRAAGEDWFCFEQPDRDGSALAALGVVAAADGLRPGPLQARRGRVARARRAGAVADAPDGPPGAGLVAVGGFAFAPDGGHAPHWVGLRRGRSGRPRGVAGPPRRRRPAHLGGARRAGRRPRGARRAAVRAGRGAAPVDPLPLLDPAPVGRFRVDSVAPPEHYEAAVARAVERIRAGAFEKIVLAREVTVQAPDAARRRRRLRRPASRLPVLLRLLRRPRRRGLRRRLARAADPPRRPPRPDGRAGRLHPPLRRPRRRRPPRRAAAALREGPRGAGDRRPPHLPRAAPPRGLGRRPGRADPDQGREHPAPRHPDPRPTRPPDRARSNSPACSTRRPPSAASRTRPPCR